MITKNNNIQTINKLLLLSCHFICTACFEVTHYFCQCSKMFFDRYLQSVKWISHLLIVKKYLSI